MSAAKDTARRPAVVADAILRSAGTRATGVAKIDTDAKEEDDGNPWRHTPVAAVDEPNPLKSLGRAIADVVTDAEEGEPEQPKR
jgi:hypothetical protein